MGMFGKGGGIVVGIILIVAGALLKSGLVEWLLDVTGWIIIIIGVIFIIVSVVGLVSGNKSGSGGF